MSASTSQLLGTAATAYGVAAPLSALLQARQMLARRSSREVSVRFFASYAGGYAIWLLYGLSAGSTPLIVVDAVGVLCAGLTLAVALALRGSLVRLASWTGRAIPVPGEGPEPAPAAIANAVARQISSENRPAPANPDRAPGATVIDQERPGAAKSQIPRPVKISNAGRYPYAPGYECGYETWAPARLISSALMELAGGGQQRRPCERRVAAAFCHFAVPGREA